MSVEVTFQPAGISGLVAEGTYIIDAAKRMGVPILADCRGQGECTTCVVRVVAGQPLLSVPTYFELRILGGPALMENHRLACQALAERSGELVIEVMTCKGPTNNGPASEVRKQFAGLPLNRKLATLVQLEVATVVDALDALAARSAFVGEKLIDRLGKLGKASTGGNHSRQSSVNGQTKK